MTNVFAKQVSVDRLREVVEKLNFGFCVSPGLPSWTRHRVVFVDWRRFDKIGRMHNRSQTMPMDLPPDTEPLDTTETLARVGTFSSPKIPLGQYDSVDPAFLVWAASKGIDPGGVDVIPTAFLEVDGNAPPHLSEERHEKLSWYLANHALYQWLTANDMPPTKDNGKYPSRAGGPSTPDDAD